MHEPTTTVILLNIFVQFVNIVIFFVIFKKFFAGKIIEAVERRKLFLERLKNAEKEYVWKIREAEKKKKFLIEEWITIKGKIIDDAKLIAVKEKEAIINQAEINKNKILEKSKVKLEIEKKELELARVDSVKETSLLLCKKIIWEKEMMEKYLDKVIVK